MAHCAGESLMIATMQPARIFSIPPGADFLSTLAQAFLDGRLVPGMSRDAGPLGLAATTIYVPTRRAARALADVFVGQLGGTSALLPRLVPLGLPDDAETAAIFQGEDAADALEDDVPPAIGDIARRMILTRLILQWGRAVGGAIVSVGADGRPQCHESEAMLVATQPGDAWNLSGDLAGLIDELLIEGVEWRALETLGAGAHDEYWRITLNFLDIAMAAWPAILADRGEIDTAARRVLLIDREIARLKSGAPTGPLIVAGSTGTNRATAALMAAIARVPQGAVVLPGLDLALDDASWNQIGGEGAAGHPQAAMRRLLPLLGIGRGDVVELGRMPEALAVRGSFLREALRPAAMTGMWQSRAERLSDEAMAAALDAVTLIEAPDERVEALALALVLREALETPERTAALITPDRSLARRVIAELRRWNIEIDESAGVPLARSGAGALARLVLACAIGGSQPIDVVALLASPLAKLGRDRSKLQPVAEAIEIGLMRGVEPPPGISVEDHVAAAKKTAAKSQDAHRAQRAIRDKTWEAIAALLHDLGAALMPLSAIAGEATIAEWIRAHRSAVLAVAVDERGAPGLSGHDGEALADLLDSVEGASPADLKFDAAGYAAVFDRLATETPVRGRHADHPRVKILGLLEARLLSADVVALGGLDETIWPPQARTDAFLNRPMRTELGLTPPERRIGQTAHDFVQALGAAPKVVISRALKRDGAPTVASRLVQRMAAVAGPDVWQRCRADGQRTIAWAQALGRADKLTPIEAPEPKPPVALRPKALSVTRIEKLRRDPYAIYAEQILKLKPLEPIAAPAGPREFGNTMHDILSRFAQAWPKDFLPLTATHDLEMMARDSFADQFDDPDFRAFQWPRIQRNLATYLRWEKARRPGINQIICEKRGVWEIPLSAGDAFRLSATADRIEIGRDGRLTIVDYKTGAAPTAKVIAAGFSPQLTLEAAIAVRGAFADISPGRPIAEGIYVRLATRGDADPKPLSWGKTGPTFPELAEKHYGDLLGLLALFARPDTPYRSRPYPQYASQFGDYDHLARVGEWGVGEPDVGADA